MDNTTNLSAILSKEFLQTFCKDASNSQFPNGSWSRRVQRICDKTIVLLVSLLSRISLPPLWFPPRSFHRREIDGSSYAEDATRISRERSPEHGVSSATGSRRTGKSTIQPRTNNVYRLISFFIFRIMRYDDN